MSHTEDVLTDLLGRMKDAEAKLIHMADSCKPKSDQRKRLEAKANGVALARSYVTEVLHRVQAGVRPT